MCSYVYIYACIHVMIKIYVYTYIHIFNAPHAVAMTSISSDGPADMETMSILAAGGCGPPPSLPTCQRSTGHTHTNVLGCRFGFGVRVNPQRATPRGFELLICC